MGTKGISFKNIFYFCNVKNSLRHDVAAESSVFRAPNLLVKYNPNDGGRSNAHKGSALDTLTHRIGVFICQKFNVMNNEKEMQQDALLEAAENIQSMLNNLWSTNELWKSLAKAGTDLAFLQRKIRNGFKLAEDELDSLVTLVNQFGTIIRELEQFENAEK